MLSVFHEVISPDNPDIPDIRSKLLLLHISNPQDIADY